MFLVAGGHQAFELGRRVMEITIDRRIALPLHLRIVGLDLLAILDLYPKLPDFEGHRLHVAAIQITVQIPAGRRGLIVTQQRLRAQEPCLRPGAGGQGLGERIIGRLPILNQQLRAPQFL